MSDWSPWRLLLLACALLFAPVMTVYDGWTYMRLVQDGVTVPAAVTSKSTSSSRNSTSYHVEYTFRDEGRRRWSGSQSIGHERYTSLRIGQSLQVTFYRSNPSVSVAFMDVLRERVAVFSCFSLAIGLLVGGFAGWWHYAQARTREHDADVLHRAPAA